MDTLSLFQEEYIIGFILLFVRVTALFAFLPFFSNMAIPMSIKSAFALYLTFMFYPLIEQPDIPNQFEPLAVAIITEILFAMSVGLILNMAHYMITYAGEQISLIMGFSMATVFDTQNMTSMPMLSQFLGFLALMVLLATDAHHSMLMFFYQSLSDLPLGGFVLTEDLFNYAVLSFKNLFVMGLSMAFPILALSILSDIIFGMLMKTMPQFNLLVIGFPIKIGVGFLVLIASISSMLFIFKREFFNSFQELQMLF
jgi:flagellar biosynthetic protein FliR